MTRCPMCQESRPAVAHIFDACGACLRRGQGASLSVAAAAHERCRSSFGLPTRRPDETRGVACRVCAHACRIGPGQRGYCGLRSNQDGRLVGATADEGKASWYHDPLPTNCVADWVCAGGTGAGFPTYAHRPGPEYGYSNLAVFFHACTFDCLYCQNWTYRTQTLKPGTASPADLAGSVSPRTSCICFFGGDPTAQTPFAVKASRAARRRSGGLLRICWETNGSASTRYLDQMAELSLESGGCVKFDLKAWDRDLHRALTGVDNQVVLENFRRVARWIDRRPEPPLLVASTLMVPGYVDAKEVAGIAAFIAGLDPSIPYALLAYSPQFRMSDLPATSRRQSEACLAAAREAGLKRVRVGNLHLLE